MIFFSPGYGSNIYVNKHIRAHSYVYMAWKHKETMRRREQEEEEGRKDNEEGARDWTWAEDNVIIKLITLYVRLKKSLKESTKR